MNQSHLVKTGPRQLSCPASSTGVSTAGASCSSADDSSSPACAERN